MTSRSKLGKRSIVVLFASVVLVALAGCSLVPPPAADLTRYYVLTGSQRASTAAQVNGSVPAQSKPRVGLFPVDLPAYLRGTKSMVVRDSGNEIVFKDYARWAEALDSGLTRVVSQHLLASGTVAGVEALPGRVDRDFDLRIRMQECEGVRPASGGHPVVRFSATYEWVSPDGSTVFVARDFVAKEQNWDGSDFGSLAQLLSDAAVALADDIVANLPQKGQEK